MPVGARAGRDQGVWSVAVTAGDITRVSLLLYLEPVVSVLGAAVFLGEHVTLTMIGGGLMIMAGVAIAITRRDHGESKPADQG